MKPIQLEDVNTTEGTWSVPDKRIQTNRKNLVEFFSGQDKHGQPRGRILRILSPLAFIRIARLYLAYEDEILNLFAYARRFKKAVGQITEADVQAAADEIAVHEVMES